MDAGDALADDDGADPDVAGLDWYDCSVCDGDSPNENPNPGACERGGDCAAVASAGKLEVECEWRWYVGR